MTGALTSPALVQPGPGSDVSRMTYSYSPALLKTIWPKLADEVPRTVATAPPAAGIGAPSVTAESPNANSLVTASSFAPLTVLSTARAATAGLAAYLLSNCAAPS